MVVSYWACTVIIFFDFVARYLEAIGYKVNYIRNITDVDDKIIKSQAENTSCNAVQLSLSQHYMKMQKNLEIKSQLLSLRLLLILPR